MLNGWMLDMLHPDLDELGLEFPGSPLCSVDRFTGFHLLAVYEEVSSAPNVQHASSDSCTIDVVPWPS
jgi:hypothetical protein